RMDALALFDASLRELGAIGVLERRPRPGAPACGRVPGARHANAVAEVPRERMAVARGDRPCPADVGGGQPPLTRTPPHGNAHRQSHAAMRHSRGARAAPCGATRLAGGPGGLCCRTRRHRPPEVRPAAPRTACQSRERSAHPAGVRACRRIGCPIAPPKRRGKTSSAIGVTGSRGLVVWKRWKEARYVYKDSGRRAERSMSTKALAILVGGGPAPGINAVIAAATIEARNRGLLVLGCHDGYHWLMQRDLGHVEPLEIAALSRIHFEGGSVLRTSRANPAKSVETLGHVAESLERLGASYLLTIGGDDTASGAAAVARVLGGKLCVAHVPKTIDNDLPLPPGVPTFGFTTAVDIGKDLVRNLMKDA